MSDCPNAQFQGGGWGGAPSGPGGLFPPGAGSPGGQPPGGQPPRGKWPSPLADWRANDVDGGKPITGGPATIAFHTASLDPLTGLPRGESPPASPAALLSLICGFLMCLGPITGLTAIAAGFWGLRVAAQSPESVGGRTMARVGIGLGVINLLFSAVAGAIFVFRVLVD